MKKKVIKWFLVILWCIFIFTMSTDVGSSSNTSSFLQEFLSQTNFLNFNLWTLEDQNLVLTSINFFIRKGAHIGEYFILAILLVSLIKEYHVQKGKIIFLSLMISFLYASFDELHQMFLLSRTGTFKDVFYDFVGSILGTLICFITYERYIESFKILKKDKKIEKDLYIS